MGISKIIIFWGVKFMWNDPPTFYTTHCHTHLLHNPLPRPPSIQPIATPTFYTTHCHAHLHNPLPRSPSTQPIATPTFYTTHCHAHLLLCFFSVWLRFISFIYCSEYLLTRPLPLPSIVALVREHFLQSSGSQLTYHGLCELNASVSEGEIVVFFRNNHFSTMMKRQVGGVSWYQCHLRGRVEWMLWGVISNEYALDNWVRGVPLITSNNGH